MSKNYRKITWLIFSTIVKVPKTTRFFAWLYQNLSFLSHFFSYKTSQTVNSAGSNDMVFSQRHTNSHDWRKLCPWGDLYPTNISSQSQFLRVAACFHILYHQSRAVNVLFRDQNSPSTRRRARKSHVAKSLNLF